MYCALCTYVGSKLKELCIKFMVVARGRGIHTAIVLMNFEFQILRHKSSRALTLLNSTLKRRLRKYMCYKWL